MQFANAAGIQAHVHTSDVLGNTECSHSDLAGPATGFRPHMSVREREAQIRQRAVIGGGRHQDIRILPVPREVTRTWISATMPWAARLRDRLGGLCTGSSGNGESASSSGCRQYCTSRNFIHDFGSSSMLEWRLALFPNL